MVRWDRGATRTLSLLQRLYKGVIGCCSLIVSPFILTEEYALRLNLMGTTELRMVGRFPLAGLGGQLYHHLLSFLVWASNPFTQACTLAQHHVQACCDLI